MTILIVDNGSSYTDELAVLLDCLNVVYRRIKPFDLDLETLSVYSGIVLSGRKRNDRLVNKVNSKVIKYAIYHDVRLLGICYGAEILALTLGGTIKRSDTPQKNTHNIVSVYKDLPIVDKGIVSVYESHSYEISRLPNVLEVVGGSDACAYEIIKHVNRDGVYGMQFHPEMSRDGRFMIERFCKL